jgi:glycosyltransferase involved in cell wall biosynthesis
MTQENQPSERPLLSFAIPTYNRAKCLDQLLGALLKQLDDESRVEVIVSDNASTDNTSTVVEMYRQQGLPVRYLRNETNRGPDFNILQCYEQAIGRYVWVFGDDDMILPGSIEAILKHLECGAYDLIHLRVIAFRDNLPAKIRPDRYRRHATTLTDVRMFARAFGGMLCLISANIINKDRVLSLQHPPFAEFLGTSLVQLSWMYPLMTNFTRALYVVDTFVAVREGNRGGYRVFDVNGAISQQINRRLLAGYPHLQDIMQACAIQKCLPFLVLQSRLGTFGNFELEDPHKQLKPVFGSSYQYWMFVFPIARGPLWLAKAWLFGVQRIDSLRTNAEIIRDFLKHGEGCMLIVSCIRKLRKRFTALVAG